MQVWKFPLWLRDVVSVMMPKGSKVLSLQLQRGETTAWALVDETAPEILRKFHIVGTGHPADHVAGLPFIGTLQLENGLVFHYFDGGEISTGPTKAEEKVK